jgi:arylsulfatase A-like enzyme
LLPLLHGQVVAAWRDFAISEIDFSDRDAINLLDLPPELCRIYMLRTARWKYLLHETFRPQLYDLAADPDEFHDLGADPAYAAVRAELHEALFTWLRRRRQRVTVPLEHIRDKTAAVKEADAGILIGYW